LFPVHGAAEEARERVDPRQARRLAVGARAPDGRRVGGGGPFPRTRSVAAMAAGAEPLVPVSAASRIQPADRAPQSRWNSDGPGGALARPLEDLAADLDPLDLRGIARDRAVPDVFHTGSRRSRVRLRAGRSEDHGRNEKSDSWRSPQTHASVPRAPGGAASV